MSDDAERDEAICQKARAALVRDAIRWTDWCAGQGICAVKSEGITDPDDLLMEYTATTGDEEWGTLPDRVSSLEATLRAEIAEQARLNGMGSEREARLMAEVADLKATNSMLCQEVAKQVALRIKAEAEAEENERAMEKGR